MNLSFNLYRLQSIDTQYRKITRRLAQIEQILLADETVRAANEQKMLAEEAERKIHSEIKEIQARSQEKKIKLELHQKSLFGGKVRNPKELQDLQAESEVLRRNIQKLEDEQLDAMLEIVERDPNQKGFHLLPRRWVVERTFAWLDRFRRLSKDYEHDSSSSETVIYLASIRTMLRRLTA